MKITYQTPLQKRLNRKIGDKEYVKHYVNIPNTVIEKIGWKDGDILAVQYDGKNLTISTKKETEEADL